jgi:hypothetical protein
MAYWRSKITVNRPEAYLSGDREFESSGSYENGLEEGCAVQRNSARVRVT